MTKQNKKLLKHIAITLLFPALAVQFYSGGTGAGNCLSFDGNDYVNIPKTSSMKPTSAVSVKGWIYRNNMKFIVLGDLHYGGGAQSYGYGLSIENDLKVYWTVAVTSTYKQVVSNSTIPQGIWIHIAGVYDGSNLIIYINGINDASVAASGTINYSTEDIKDHDFKIGRDPNPAGTHWFNGQYDEIVVYNRALTQTEIRDNMCKKLKGNESGLVGYWRFDEGSGNTVYDASGNGNNGTLY